MLTKLCTLDAPVDGVSESHCWRCHYAVTRHKVLSDYLGWECRNRNKVSLVTWDEYKQHSSWWRTGQLIWSTFCLQWPLIGWAMIMGKE